MSVDERNLFQSKLQKDLLLKCAFGSGFKRLGSAATLVAILPLTLLMKATLTAFEFLLHRVIKPMTGFSYYSLVCWCQAHKAEGPDQ
ncbi:MAG: hypothetical protein KJ556_00865 [Gammaproteobacteria bacterium]|nr:hypothetical protein [Gammaproteobacteria bacterium]MBU2059104.1 hypothetical protein [Gammaproteobacteria bacterium]MBU2173655.1 hypothetical protein [Gammaproteobacteria bacterium]MBU2246811.1 hypothetical protein [Gammaproteobacteria bacterium]MBU2343803.1 hypothetical protein [Gammaproteobacteria bacterium]